MPSMCTKCEQPVFQLEEVRFERKIYHKACFRCCACKKPLTPLSCVGHDKLPFCGIHVPKVQATTLPETLESRRLADVTRFQSTAHYQAKFLEEKGRYTTVPDDAEVVRAIAVNKQISGVVYSGMHEKKEIMEEKRALVEGFEDGGARCPVDVVPGGSKNTEGPKNAQAGDQRLPR